MATYIARRILQTIILLIILLAFVFFLIRLLPGDPVLSILDPETVTEEQIEATRRRLGLDRPLYEQFAAYLMRMARGDLGQSIQHRQPVFQLIRRDLPHTIHLAAGSIVLVVIFGVPLGIIAAILRGRTADVGVLVFALWAAATPSFWFGLILLRIFAGWLGWLPLMGIGDGSLVDTVRHTFLPAFALSVNGVGLTCRMTRSCMLEVMDQDYIRTARSKGLAEQIVMFKHALRNALIPVITVVGTTMGAMLAGSVVIETVFTRPGLGRLAVNAIFARDYAVIEGTVAIFAITFVSINLLVDITYSIIDPRIRYS